MDESAKKIRRTVHFYFNFLFLPRKSLAALKSFDLKRFIFLHIRDNVWIEDLAP